MEPLSRILFGLFRGTPRHDEWVVSCLEGAWPSLLGERIAQVCRPSSFGNGRLTIEIRDPDWNEPLRKMEAELLLRIGKGTGGEVTELRFV